jgi:hypothetical protein
MVNVNLPVDDCLVFDVLFSDDGFLIVSAEE